MARTPGEPRVRYIAFRVDGDPSLSRRELIDVIKSAGQQEQSPSFEQESGVWLTRFKGNQALVRCHHTHQDIMRQVLERIDQDPKGRPLRLTPLATSGTIRKLVEDHVPGLKETESERRQKRKTAKNANGRAPPRKNGAAGDQPTRKENRDRRPRTG